MNANTPTTDAGPDDAERPTRRLFRRRQKTRKSSFDLRKALFILPNAFTVSSIFCGFYSIIKATSNGGPHAFYQAGVALFFASFFDAFDGRVARMTRTQSDFGVQIDSLADVISFGIAPAVLVYSWALSDFDLLGMLVSFLFAACGAIRLARFNVLAARGVGSSKYFLGLPIPAAAMLLVSLVIAQSFSFSVVVSGQRQWDDGAVTARSGVVAVVVVLSYLMVSRVRFRTFKDFRPSVRTTPVLVAVLLALVAAVAILKAALALVCAVSAYVLLGLVEEVVFFRRRRLDAEAAARAALAATASTPEKSTA